MPALKLTNTSILKLPAPPFKDDGKPQQAIYRDTDHPGLGVRVTSSGKRVFIAEKIVNRKVIRTTLGDAEQITVKKAWDEAQKVFGKIAGGVNPNEEKREDRARSVTLGEVLDDYLGTRKNLAARTVADYRRLINAYLDDWKDKPLTAITKDMVEKRHAKLGADRGEAQANYCMRVLRALFNYGMEKYEVGDQPIIAVNPVRRLSSAKAWFRDKRRTTYIKPDQLKPWFAALQRAEDEQGRDYLESTRDYLQLLMLTGMRRSEGLGLKWADVDLPNKQFTIRDPKNHVDHTLPMSDYLAELFERRKKNKHNDYVFPGIGAKNRPQHEPKKGIAAVVKLSKIPFALHDLRRTFITTAESLDISAYALKRLLNHKMTNDVTAGYIITDVERLRKPMQQITDYILRMAGLRQTAEVADLDAAREAKGKTAA